MKTKSSQFRCGVSHVYLECKTKRVFAIACLRKKLGFHTEYCDYFEYLILNNFENGSFWLGHRVDQMEPILVETIPKVGRLWDRKNFWYSLPRKEVSFSCGNVHLFQISNFKKRSFENQTKPNSVWSIPFVPRVYNKKNFCYSLSTKKVRFSYGIMRLFRIFNFK